jgi:DNA-binding response OmpR family regulator
MVMVEGAQSAGFGTTGAARVLLVEDEANIALALQFLLQREGYDVVHVENGREALEAVPRMRPDLILLDVTLPEVSGYEICQCVKSDASLAGIRILVLTARGTEVEKRKALALGADGFMSKPFDTKQLADAVAALLEVQ